MLITKDHIEISRSTLLKRNVALSIFIFSMFSISILNAQQKPTVNITFQFANTVNNRPLVLGDSLNRYNNENGDDYYITLFKYYISNIVLTDQNDHSVALKDTYLLLNANESNTFTQTIKNVPEGIYKSISFLIGVDSLKNCSGAQEGSLDPINAMFWTWKSGYIFLKMEGISTKSTSRGNRLVFHIGGDISPNNTLRSYTKNFENPIKIEQNKNAIFHIIANVNGLFHGKNKIDFAKLNFTMGGANSMLLADNYAENLFSVQFENQ